MGSPGGLALRTDFLEEGPSSLQAKNEGGVTIGWVFLTVPRPSHLSPHLSLLLSLFQLSLQPAQRTVGAPAMHALL